MLVCTINAKIMNIKSLSHTDLLGFGRPPLLEGPL